MMERLRPAVFWIFAAVAEEPMKPMASMPSWETSLAPKSPSPGRMETSPSGTPASMRHSMAARTVSAVLAGGFTTWALPVARPGATNSANMSSGKFHGVMMPQTPTPRGR